MSKSLWLRLSAQDSDHLSRILVEYGIDSTHSKSWISQLAHTNHVYLVEPIDSQPVVVREVNLETFGLIDSKLEHLNFEIDVLEYLHDHGFEQVPKVLLNKHGGSVTIDKHPYVVFNQLEGEPIGNFNDLSRFDFARRQSFFNAIGRMSRVLSKYKTTRVVEKSLAQLCNDAVQSLPRLYEELNDQGRNVVEPNYGCLHTFVAQACAELEHCRYDELPKQAVHFDLHAGQALFSEYQITGIVDFDWLRMDCRVSDLASSLAMCCYVYGGEQDGLYNKEQLLAARGAFRAGFGASEYEEQFENRLLSAAFKAYLVIQFIFTCEMYIKLPTEENLVDMTHFMRLISRNNVNVLLQN